MKLLSAIALFGIANKVFAYVPSGRYDIVTRDVGDVMTISATNPLAGEVVFQTSSSVANDQFVVEYLDMKAEASPTSCANGVVIQAEAAATVTDGTADADGNIPRSIDFSLDDASIWVDNVAKVCAVLKTRVDGEDIGELEVLATITRTFTGDFSIDVVMKTKDASSFTGDKATDVNVAADLCDGDGDAIDQNTQFAQGTDFKICLDPDAGYEITGVKDVVCSYGVSGQDTLVNAEGVQQSLALLDISGGEASITGVVKAAYVAGGNTALSCGGLVDLKVAGTRQLKSATIRYSTEPRALQNAETTEESEFSATIQLDPTGGSSAASIAISIMVSIVLVAAASVAIFTV